MRGRKNAETVDHITDMQSVDHRDISYDRAVNIDEQTWALMRMLISVSGEEKVKQALWVLLLEGSDIDPATAERVAGKLVAKAAATKAAKAA